MPICEAEFPHPVRFVLKLRFDRSDLSVGAPACHHVQIQFCYAVVDGGQNPRKSGAGRKTGTNLAVDLFTAYGLGGKPLSTPLAAEGGGRRPAFTGVATQSHLTITIGACCTPARRCDDSYVIATSSAPHLRGFSQPSTGGDKDRRLPEGRPCSSRNGQSERRCRPVPPG